MDIKKELIGIVLDYVDIPEDRIDTGSSFKSAGLDSFGILAMVASIEEHFRISIPNDELKKFKTLDDIIVYVENNI